MRATQITITIAALAIAAVHSMWPDYIKIDSITLTLLIVATVPWLAQIFKALEFPGGYKVEFQEWQKAAENQASATLHQTIATIISWVQAEDVRQSRRLLYDLEKTRTISKLPDNQWKDEWKQAADRVSQTFNGAAIIARLDERLERSWIRGSRRAILRSWCIVRPRVEERRKEEADLWQDFDWLADKAKGFCTSEELKSLSRREAVVRDGTTQG